MFRKLLVPLDRSPFAEQALGRAAAIARASRAGMDVMLVHEPHPFAGYVDDPWNAEQFTDELEYLEATVAELASGASIAATHAVLRGDAVEMICARALDVGADLVVMASHGRTGLRRAWLGSVADGVVRRSAIPVLMLHSDETPVGRRSSHQLFKRVLVTLDGSALAMEVLPAAIALARCSGAGISLLRVVEPVPLIVADGVIPFAYPPPLQDSMTTDRLVNEAMEQIGDIVRTVTAVGGLEVDGHVIVADQVAHAILDFVRAHHVDVIAMSTHGRGASRLVVGSIADKLIRDSGVPVMLQRPAVMTVPMKRANRAQEEQVLIHA